MNSVRPRASEAGGPVDGQRSLCVQGLRHPAHQRRQWWHTQSAQGRRQLGVLASSPATGSPAPHSPWWGWAGPGACPSAGRGSTGHFGELYLIASLGSGLHPAHRPPPCWDKALGSGVPFLWGRQGADTHWGLVLACGSFSLCREIHVVREGRGKAGPLAARMGPWPWEAEHTAGA